jgi:hypothetical protein
MLSLVYFFIGVDHIKTNTFWQSFRLINPVAACLFLLSAKYNQSQCLQKMLLPPWVDLRSGKYPIMLPWFMMRRTSANQ